MGKGAVINEFDEKIGRLTQSRAYLDFCEEVYGVRLCLFNMMDKEQLDYLLHSIPIASDDTVLDLGCGDGRLLALIVAEYGCTGVGIDLLEGPAMTHSGAIRYIRGDIDELADYGIAPSITLSVDSLYFSRDIDRLTRELSRTGSGRLYLFYSQYLFGEAEDRGLLQSQNTRLGQALDKAGVAYRTLDFSENERRLYDDMEGALQKREQAFAAEGNAELYAQKLREVQLGRELYETGRAARYLYIREADNASAPR